MNISIIKPAPEHTEEISRICSVGWRQTVQDVYDEEYQLKNVEQWYNHERVHKDIVKGTYTHVALVDGKVAGTIGGAMTGPGVSEIYVFYVDDNYRYKEIGAKLLEVFIKEHIERDAKEQSVSVREGNEFGIPFYKAPELSATGSEGALFAANWLRSVFPRFKLTNNHLFLFCLYRFDCT